MINMTNEAVFSEALCKQARDCAQPIKVAWDSPKIKGPALVYTAWNGASCGASHNFSAISEAGKKLGVPVYVINGSPGEILSSDRQGQRIEPRNFNDMANILGDYNLFVEDKHIRLVGADGKVVGSQDVVSSKGADAIVNAFKDIVQSMRPKAEARGFLRG